MVCQAVVLPVLRVPPEKFCWDCGGSWWIEMDGRIHGGFKFSYCSNLIWSSVLIRCGVMLSLDGYNGILGKVSRCPLVN